MMYFSLIFFTLLKIHDLSRNLGKSRMSAFILLDLSSAFDTINQQLLCLGLKTVSISEVLHLNGSKPISREGPKLWIFPVLEVVKRVS